MSDEYKPVWVEDEPVDPRIAEITAQFESRLAELVERHKTFAEAEHAALLEVASAAREVAEFGSADFEYDRALWAALAQLDSIRNEG